jgi:hypothetical protein
MTSGWRAVDWRDIRFAVVVGVVSLILKLLELTRPELGMSGPVGFVPFVLILGYAIYRGRREPEKLEEWGLTTAVTAQAVIVAGLLFLLSLVVIGVGGLQMAGRLSFEWSYLPAMIMYVDDGFSQQFFMCSVGLVSLAKLPVFRGLWRLPLVVGAVFALAHFWTPHRIPGTIIPLQMILTFPAGFGCAYYFLRYRTVLPLAVLHAVLYVLLHNWIEAYL